RGRVGRPPRGGGGGGGPGGGAGRGARFRSAGPPRGADRSPGGRPPPVGPWTWGATCSSVVEDDAVAAIGVGPGDGTLVVADHVAGPTLETLLVVEEDAAVGRGSEEVGRAGRDAAPGGARPADVGVHSDVGPLADAEVDAGHGLLEGDAAPGQSLRRRGVPAERQRSVRRP